MAPDYGVQFISAAHVYRVQVEDALDGYAGNCRYKCSRRKKDKMILVISAPLFGLRFVAANGRKDCKSSPMTPTILDRSASFTTWLEEDTALEPKSWRSDQLSCKEVDIPIKLSNNWFSM